MLLHLGGAFRFRKAGAVVIATALIIESLFDELKLWACG